MSPKSPNTIKDKYYNRYWTKDLFAQSQGHPPQWTESNLNWHYQFFKPYLGRKILDIGCGDGVWANFLKLHQPSNLITGIDQSNIAIDKASSSYPRLNFRHLDIEELPQLRQKFDTIFAIEVLEHLLDIDLCLDRIYHQLKPGGHFCVTTTDFNLPKKIIIATLFWDKFFYPNNPHIRFFTKKSLVHICHRHHLHLVNYRWNLSYLGLMPRGQMAVFQRHG